MWRLLELVQPSVHVAKRVSTIVRQVLRLYAHAATAGLKLENVIDGRPVAKSFLKFQKFSRKREADPRPPAMLG